MMGRRVAKQLVRPKRPECLKHIWPHLAGHIWPATLTTFGGEATRSPPFGRPRRWALPPRVVHFSLARCRI